MWEVLTATLFFFDYLLHSYHPLQAEYNVNVHHTISWNGVGSKALVKTCRLIMRHQRKKVHIGPTWHFSTNMLIFKNFYKCISNICNFHVLHLMLDHLPTRLNLFHHGVIAELHGACAFCGEDLKLCNLYFSPIRCVSH